MNVKILKDVVFMLLDVGTAVWQAVQSAKANGKEPLDLRLRDIPGLGSWVFREMEINEEAVKEAFKDVKDGG